MREDRAFLCSVCFVPISTSGSKMDESGRPVHAECLATRELYLSSRKPIARNNLKREWYPIWEKRKVG
jgi:hypothetical protein